MKKTYISPQAQVKGIATLHIFCASEGVQGTSLPGGKASNQYETLSRRYNVWDDEEDGDYDE